MHLIRIIVLPLVACSAVLAQPVSPRSVGGDASVPAAAAGANRRSELKAVLRSKGQESAGASGALDEKQRQQLRRQLREQSHQ